MCIPEIQVAKEYHPEVSSGPKCIPGAFPSKMRVEASSGNQAVIIAAYRISQRNGMMTNLQVSVLYIEGAMQVQFHHQE